MSYREVRAECGHRDEINLRFPGHDFAVEIGLHYNRCRYYDPVLGGYLQCGPLGVAGGYNLYAYLANPLTRVDILGIRHGGQQERGSEQPGGGKRPKKVQTAKDRGTSADEALPVVSMGAVALFHGTTDAGAQSILSEGLLPVSRHTAPYPAGSFFTHIGEDAPVAASHWAARSSNLYSGRPLVLRGTLSHALFDTLRKQGLIQTSSVPGLPFFPLQTVILPEALDTINGQIQWTIVPLML